MLEQYLQPVAVSPLPAHLRARHGHWAFLFEGADAAVVASGLLKTKDLPARQVDARSALPGIWIDRVQADVLRVVIFENAYSKYRTRAQKRLFPCSIRLKVTKA